MVPHQGTATPRTPPGLSTNLAQFVLLPEQHPSLQRVSRTRPSPPSTGVASSQTGTEFLPVMNRTDGTVTDNEREGPGILCHQLLACFFQKCDSQGCGAEILSTYVCEHKLGPVWSCCQREPGSEEGAGAGLPEGSQGVDPVPGLGDSPPAQDVMAACCSTKPGS